MDKAFRWLGTKSSPRNKGRETLTLLAHSTMIGLFRDLYHLMLPHGVSPDAANEEKIAVRDKVDEE